MEYNENNPLRIFTSFSGYDSQMMALQRLRDNFPGFAFECVGWSEVDKNAILAHNALFPEAMDKNYGDISKIDWDKVPDFDLFTMSSPCQDFSMSGKRRGGEEGSGTRSSLLWECTKAIEIKRPRFVFFENVKGLITSKFIKGFHKWQARLEGLGYANFAQIMNASDYGVPQNRERVFMVSILRNGEPPKYYFPKKQRLDVRVKDLLERNVSEEYYLSEEALENFCSLGKGGEPFEGEWRGEDVEPILQCADGTSPTITASCGNMGAANLRDLGHFPIQGAMVKGDYHEKED